MNERITDQAATSAEALVGTWRRFGPTGPVYQVVKTGESTGDNDVLMTVKVLQTDEIVDYRLSEILRDPQES